MARLGPHAKLAKAAKLSAEAARLYAEAADELATEKPEELTAPPRVTEIDVARARKVLRRLSGR